LLMLILYQLNDSIKKTKEDVRKSMQASWGKRSMEYENKLRQGQTETEKLKTKLHETQDELEECRRLDPNNAVALKILREESKLDKDKLVQHEQRLQAQNDALAKGEEERRSLQARSEQTKKEYTSIKKCTDAQRQEISELKATIASFAQINARVTSSPYDGTPKGKTRTTTSPLLSDPPELTPETMRFGQDAEKRNSQSFGSHKNTSNTASKVTRPTTPVGVRLLTGAASPVGVRFSTAAASVLEIGDSFPDNPIHSQSQSQDVSQSPSDSRLSQANRTPLKSSLKRKSTLDLPAVPAKKTKVAQASNTTPSNRPVQAQSIGFQSAQSSPQQTPGTATRKSVGALSHVRTSAGLTKSKTGPLKTYSTKPTSTTTTKSSSTKPTRTASGSQ